MFKFALGLTSGIIVGATGMFAAGVLVAVIIEDSPEIRKLVKETVLN